MSKYLPWRSRMSLTKPVLFSEPIRDRNMLKGYLVFYCEWFLRDFSQIYLRLHILIFPSDLPSLHGRVGWRKGFICWTWPSKASTSRLFKINNSKKQLTKALITLRTEPQTPRGIVRIPVRIWDRRAGKAGNGALQPECNQSRECEGWGEPWLSHGQTWHCLPLQLTSSEQPVLRNECSLFKNQFRNEHLKLCPQDALGQTRALSVSVSTHHCRAVFVPSSEYFIFFLLYSL